ncbi:MAG: hypothetical protein BGO49_07835 [Planctomycetales bacterium 71-10]|nr:MAG: hypothetical protein BGO49_07835 [Planctomycetales bacterium 71-10]
MSRHRAEDVPTSPAEARRLPGLQTILTLAAACAALFWVARATRDALEPANYLVRMLRNGDAEQKIEAAKGLGEDEAGPAFRPKAAEALAAALADPDEEVAAGAAHSLAALIQAEADGDLARSWADALAAGLRDPRPEVRGATAAAFTFRVPPQAGRRSRIASDALAALVDDPIEDVRLVAIVALAASGTGEAGVRALVKVLESGASTADRSAAARALGGYPDHGDEATLALLRGLKSGRDEVVGACGSALATLRFRADGPRRSAALVPDLIAASADPDRAVRAHAATILGEIGPEAVAAVPALVAMLGEADDGPGKLVPGPILAPPAALAAEALGRVAPGTPKEGEAAEALAAVFLEPRRSAERDVGAALALARFPGASGAAAVPRLLAILEGGIATAHAAGSPTTSFDIDDVHARRRVASRAAEALALLAPGTPRAPEVVAALVRALDSDAITLHAATAEALGRFGPLASPALPRLREMVKLEDPGRRRAAREAVRRIETPSTDAPTPGRERPPRP